MLRFDIAQRDIFFIILFLFLPSLAYSQSPKFETRAVWISSASGDWPKSTNVAEQQRSLIEIFDNLKKHNFNTVFFQKIQHHIWIIQAVFGIKREAITIVPFRQIDHHFGYFLRRNARFMQNCLNFSFRKTHHIVKNGI